MLERQIYQDKLADTLQQIGNCVEQIVEEFMGVLLHVIVKQFYKNYT